MMLLLIVTTFTVTIYMAGARVAGDYSRAPIAAVDEDEPMRIPRIAATFSPPQNFISPTVHAFVFHILSDFRRGVLRDTYRSCNST